MKAFSFLLENLGLEDLEGDDRMKVTKVDGVGNILEVGKTCAFPVR